MTVWQRKLDLFDLSVVTSEFTNLTTKEYDDETKQSVNIDNDTMSALPYDPERPQIDSATGLILSRDNKLGRALYPPSRVYDMDDEHRDLYPLLVEKLGPLGYREFHGAFPALQLGGLCAFDDSKGAIAGMRPYCRPNRAFRL